MIIKTNNKEKNFYYYMGRIFGSRLIQKQTNDRIYDDNDKEWYLNIEEERVVALVSISKNVIKNVYATKDNYLEELLKVVKEEKKIQESVITNLYQEIYKKVGFSITHTDHLKNFIIVYNK